MILNILTNTDYKLTEYGLVDVEKGELVDVIVG
jgi:adenine deaminase